MIYGIGRGRGSGRGGGSGMAFRGMSPPWPYVGRGRGGLPRCGYYYGSAVLPYQPTAYAGTFAASDYSQHSTTAAGSVDELGLLKDRAETLKKQLSQIEVRLQELEDEK
jgi:hypothetical protein